MNEDVKKYFFVVDGERVEVKKDVYDFLRKSKSQTDYIENGGRNKKRKIRNENGKIIAEIPGLEDSFDRYNIDDSRFADQQSSYIEELIINKLLIKDLMSKLYRQEEYIIYQYYFIGKTEREIAEEMQISQQNLHKKRMRILAKLNKLLE